MNAGIAMKDFLVATTTGLLNNAAVLDLIYQEETKQNCEFVIVYYSKTNNIAYMSLNCNKIGMKEFKNLLELSQESCDSLRSTMRRSIQDKLLCNLSSFYNR
mmetsp:Transcript_12950/g.20059  ORF Transcript_12950/g.20059 Transcript_12950/m.20059 type:complete len:102 (-) Transcript_12950:8-313(-)